MHPRCPRCNYNVHACKVPTCSLVPRPPQAFNRGIGFKTEAAINSLGTRLTYLYMHVKYLHVKYLHVHACTCKWTESRSGFTVVAVNSIAHNFSKYGGTALPCSVGGLSKWDTSWILYALVSMQLMNSE